MNAAGRVWAHVGQAFGEESLDVAVVGAGRMGAALALYLRQLCPERSLLLIEEGGLPNEEGATILAPGVWTELDVPPERLDAAHWTREQLAELDSSQFEPRPVIQLSPAPLPGSRPSAEVLAGWPEVLPLLDLSALPFARLDARAATFRPGNVALNAAQQAIKLGANLLLNTRVRLPPARHGQPPHLLLERLTVTNTHQIVTHETLSLRAGTVVVAAGAGGPALIEHGLGHYAAHGRAYQQYPRLELASGPQTPVLRVPGLTLRPQQGGFTLVPTLRGRDPHAYQPSGGSLTGVPTGLRREVLEELVGLMESVPALASDRLQVGRSLSDIPGAWVALPRADPSAPPLWEQAAPGFFLLLGGPQADTLGLAAAQALAREIAGSGD